MKDTESSVQHSMIRHPGIGIRPPLLMFIDQGVGVSLEVSYTEPVYACG